jgi:hypothetical protein
MARNSGSANKFAGTSIPEARESQGLRQLGPTKLCGRLSKIGVTSRVAMRGGERQESAGRVSGSGMQADDVVDDTEQVDEA